MVEAVGLGAAAAADTVAEGVEGAAGRGPARFGGQ